jgi:hypothetical protein
MKPRSELASCGETRGSDTRHSVGDSFTSETLSFVGGAGLSAITRFLFFHQSPIATLRIGALTSLGQSPDSRQG